MKRLRESLSMETFLRVGVLSPPPTKGLTTSSQPSKTLVTSGIKISIRKLEGYGRKASGLDRDFPALLCEQKLLIEAAQVRTPPAAPDRRRLNREELHQRASLVVNRSGHEQRFSCVILDSSTEGFRVRGVCQLRRGQVVELILDEDPLKALRCSVVWAGKPETKYECEVGLESVSNFPQ